MKPKRQPRDTFELFRSRFDPILNPDHELIRLAQQIDGPRFETAFADYYSPDMGAPGKDRKRYEFGQKISVATTNRSHWFRRRGVVRGESLRRPYVGLDIASRRNQHRRRGTRGTTHSRRIWFIKLFKASALMNPPFDDFCIFVSLTFRYGMVS
ncbi:MAG: hypothetical protein JXA11_15145 [Phycisphaerae bacterium]|nr:hypothetical protein [Phycisphaerae bacterium]